MKIVKPSAKLLAYTKNPEQLIERCGRVCYKSEDKITEGSAIKFVNMLNTIGHHSVLEHAVATILFICDRGVTHELVRHRIASYSQESTRYCNYSKDKFNNELTFIEPPELNIMQRDNWLVACLKSEEIYQYMINDKVKPQIARSILPNCLKTEIAVTANFREWLHILKLRTSLKAHPQIKEIMDMAAKLLCEISPIIFKDYVNG